jgi:argininosuccinate lyase
VIISNDTPDPTSPSGAAPELTEAGFAVEIADAPLLHQGLNLADIAHVVALHEAGVLPSNAAGSLAGLLLEVHAQPVESFPYDPAFGESYNCRERAFGERIGRTAGWLHAGRPRREAVRVALRLRLRRDLTALIADAAAFVVALSDKAEDHAETVFADHTYLQQAQPSTFGHYLLSVAHPVLRDAERLQRAVSWANASPCGAGCVNGSALVPHRARLAELLGFSSVIEHTRDAMWQTDGLLDMVSAATSLIVTLSKLAEDLEIYASQEFDFVDLAAPHTRSSVLMPQKRNPYALSMVRGQAGVVIGRLMGLFSVMKSPSARSDNLIFAYGEVPRALEAVGRSTRLMRGVVAGLEVNTERMAEVLQAGFAQATDLAEHVMMSSGIDYRSAYLIVGEAVKRASAAGLVGVDIDGALLDAAAHEIIGESLGLTGRDLSDAVDPTRLVAARDITGGAAPHRVRAMAASARALARSTAATAERDITHFDAAEASLLAMARTLEKGADQPVGPATS